MAREAPRSGAGSARVPTNVEWLESVGLRWDRMTPQQVMAYLVSKGRSVAEADEYVEGLRGTEAGSLMLWGGDG